ncbi:hypothetical protein QYM36_020037 [Artemia franciscana]|uniref:PiggyBac transposable element-derived protein domain-containing protein n=1 Tax=Artemia franciscana TaxID=6661 RepID=A0AA88H4B7_ARTSF|nr:hypothetical protein QYM36_020037 [Artemia franciscana]
MLMELQDRDVSGMLDLSDYGDDESDSQYLPLNPELTDFYELTLLGPISVRETEDQQPSAKKVNRRNRGECKWCYKDFEPYIEYQQVIGAYTPPPTESMSPAEYVSMFFSDEMTDKALLETNRYAMTKENKFIDFTKQEIYSYLSITLLLGIISLPSYKLYWEKELNYNLVSEKMSRDSFTLIRGYLHFDDNSKCKPKTDPGHDRLFKVRPIVDLLQENLMRTEPEERNIIDEQIIPFKGRSVMWLHLQNKPHKWGLKVFTQARSSGSMYNIEIYQGRGTVKAGPFGLVGDETGYDWVRTIRQNLLSGRELMEEKELKRFRMGNVDWTVEKSTDVCLVRWFDNKVVTHVSNYVAVDPKDTCRRRDSSEKKYVERKKPAVNKEYNKYMGGVD